MDIYVKRCRFRYLHERVDNKSVSIHTPQRHALVVNNVLIMPVLLV